MPPGLTLDVEGRLVERERPGEVRSSMQNLGRSRRAALTLPRQGRHRPRFPAYGNGGLALMPSVIHRSFFLKFHEYEPCRLLSQHTALQGCGSTGLGLTRPPPHPLGCVRLPLHSFPLSWALPQAFEYYECSVTVRLSPFRSSRSSLHHLVCP